MNKDDLKKLIKESILEVLREVDKDEKSDDSQEYKPEKNDPEELEVDPDVDSKAYGEDDIWPGSDIAGIKKGGTGFRHGDGHSGWNSNRRNKLDKKDLWKILHINYVNGVADKEKENTSDVLKQSTYNFIKKEMPWVLEYHNYGSKWEYPYKDEPSYPFVSHFNNEPNEEWLSRFREEVTSQLDFQTHWMEIPLEKLKNTARSNRHWIARFKTARDILKRYPTFKADLNKLVQYLSKLDDFLPTNPENPDVYPIFVTLYDVEQRLGGHEEGGWWYDKSNVIQSIKVNSYKDMRKAVAQLIKLIPSADMNGKPVIELEKVSGDSENEDVPEYS
jgi:hypothetical protein